MDSTHFALPIETEPRTRYYWKVRVWADNGEEAESEAAWFETAKETELWTAHWITPALSPSIHPILFRQFTVSKKVVRARAYMVGLGAYEWTLNGQKVGEEYLLPGCEAYDSWIQYQTYDITEFLKEENEAEVCLGNGWYKGDYGLSSKKDVYGDRFVLLAELHMEYEDGTREVLVTDTDWKARKSPVLYSDIYNGEIVDCSQVSKEVYDTCEVSMGYDKLKARLNPPIRIHERLKPIEVIHTPAGETVLDMGQNMVGWVEFTVTAPAGTRIRLQHGEILQDDCFYVENLRTAKQEFIYICHEGEIMFGAHFTFYGFRYVLVEGWPYEVRRRISWAASFIRIWKRQDGIENQQSPGQSAL